MNDLRTSLHRVADAVEPLPVDHDLWHRGVAARRRGQALVVAAVLAIIASVTWSAVLLGTDDREARTATQEVPRGAIPSRIVDPGRLTPETDLAVGRASVAFASRDGQAIVVTAVDGRYHALELTGWDGALLSLSPDGGSLAWTIESDAEGRPADGFLRMDLASGETQRLFSGADGSTTPGQISWSPSSQRLIWFAGDTVTRMPGAEGDIESSATGKQVEWAAIDDDGGATFYAQGPRQWGPTGSYGRLKIDGTTFNDARRGRNDAAIASPDGDTVALASTVDAAAVDFLTSDRFVERPLATDLYPDGAVVRPLGWATDTLVLAQVDAPQGSYAEGSHLALFTAPNTPEQQWTYRIVARDVPTQPLSLAVDLVPDLDGTSSQQLTHDFGDVLAQDQRDISWIIGLGVAAAVAVLMGLRWLWRRRFA